MDLQAAGQQAVALHQAGRLDEAEALYRQILAANPHVFPALYLLGMLRLEQSDSAEAASLLERALALNPADPGARLHHAMALSRLGQLEEALTGFDRVLAALPGQTAAMMGRAVVLRLLDRTQDALAGFESVLTLDVANADAWNGRGALLRQLGRTDDALDSFNHAIALDPGMAEAWQNRGDLHWTDRLDYDAAVTDLERALALEPDRPWLRGNLLHLKMFGADWRDFADTVARIDTGVRAGDPVVHPFIYQAISASPADLQACSRIHVRHQIAAAAPLALRARAHDKIRLGYVSGELRAHAVSYLLAGLFEHHDRSRFEVIAVDHGGGDGSPLRARLEKAFDRFVPIAGISDEDAARRVAAAEIDILINLNGYFGMPRNGVFARRPAPVQVSYMGFPATMGAPWMDYVLADRTVIPEDERSFYDEKVVYLPDTYWVNDSRRPIAEATPSRADCGLPPEGFIFCNFNNSYKLTPDSFALWMRILKQTPGSVLWLFASNNLRFAENLRREAAAQGVDASRLIFAPLLPSDQHLARLKLADLSLDCLPYNGHTTAADILWAGVPFLTCRGTSWPGRVAASLLQAMNVPELVTENLPDYEVRAVALARDPAALAAVKQKLIANRLATPLFDTARWTRNVEAAYTQMWERRQRGEAPAHFSV